MQPICSPSGRCVRVEVDGEERWGALDGDEIVLSDGVRIPEATAQYLAPASPSKILAVHLTYGSRVRGVRRAHAARAVVLHEAADDAERPPAAGADGEGRPLPQLRGRARGRRRARG